MLQWLYRYVASSCSQCFIRFSDVCCRCVYLDVAYVFTHMMQVFYLDVVYVYNGFKCFSGVFASISDACFKCFICFQSYVAIVALGFKIRSSVCISLLAFLLSRLGVRPRKMEAVPTSAGGPHVLASGHSK
jgi:hypothetical protein